MEIIPASCDYDISLINITLMNESAPGMYVLAIPYLANGFIQKCDADKRDIVVTWCRDDLHGNSEVKYFGVIHWVDLTSFDDVMEGNAIRTSWTQILQGWEGPEKNSETNTKYP